MPTVEQTRSIGPDAGSTTYISNFSPVLGGNYYDGTLNYESTRGYWWDSTAYNGATRYYLGYNGSSLYTDGSGRLYGYYVRCVSEEKDVSDLTYMQDMTAKVADSPKGWTLPSKDQIRTIGPDAGSTTYVSSFSPVLGGRYYNGGLYDKSTFGYWWVSTASNGVLRYFLGYNGSSLYTGSGSYRFAGFYVRCVQAS